MIHENQKILGMLKVFHDYIGFSTKLGLFSG